MEQQTYHFRTHRSGRTKAPLLVLLHGTGGDENQFFELGRDLMPDAHLLAPRGDVLENGMRRFFRRKAEGVYDMADLAVQAGRMATFIAGQARQLDAGSVIGLGYSNGANILAAAMMRQPSLVDAAVLMHPLIPWEPEPQPGLSGRKVLITAGRRDPICPAALTERFARWLRSQGAAVETVWHEGGHEVHPSEIDAVRIFLEDAGA